MNRETLRDVRISWHAHPGKRVVIHVPDTNDDCLARNAVTRLPQLEQVLNELIKILEPTKEQLGEPIQFYIIDDSFLSTDHTEEAYEEYDPLRLVQDLDQEAILHVLHPDDPTERIVAPLVRAALKQWFGTNAISSPFFLNGLAGVIASSCEIGPTLEQVNETVKRESQEGRSVSIFALSSTTGEEKAQTALNNDIATSFVAYLLDIYGAPALRQFFTIYDGERQDQATLIAYHRPLGQLEEAWLLSLRKTTGHKSALLLFVQRVLPLLKPYWAKSTEMLAYSVLGLTFNVVLPLSTKFLLDTIIPQKNVSLLLIFVLCMFAFFVFNALIGIRRSQLTAVVVQNVVADLQQNSFDHLQHLNHEFYGRAKVGDLMTRLSNDIQMVRQALSQVMGNAFMMVLQTITSLIVLFILQPLIGVLVVVIIPLVMLSYTSMGKRFQQASSDSQRLIGETATATQENISAHAVVKAFSLEQSMISSYRVRLLAQLKASVRLEVISALFQNSLIFASLVEQLVVLGVGGYMVIQGHITLGVLIAAWSVLPSLLTPISMFGIIIETIQSAYGSLERVIELQDEPITIADKADALVLPSLKEEIRFEHVNFTYEGDRVILDDLNLTIPAGSNVAIVGPSGSGKSSMISLLLRFWEPTGGSVLFDGHDLRDLTLNSLREQIGLVFQDTFIFDTTVRENIAVGRQGATDSEIIAAARGAKLDDYIASLPAGYNTVLGERGVRMSGGQRQRLAIARTLLRNPRVLILDEATSALDTQTEREILETLDDLKRGRTTISVTHRLTVAATADHILVLDHGKLIEQGSHDELLKKAGLYSRLYQEQAGAGNFLPEQITPASLDIDATCLRAIPLFQEMSMDLLTKVAQQVVRKRYKVGEYIVNQGEPGDAFYIIRFGQAEVLLNNRGTKRCINVLDEGDFFGEISLLADEPRTASVKTVFPTECYVLTKSSFLLLLDQEPQLRETIWQTLQQRRSELATIQAFLRQSDTMTSLLPGPASTQLNAEQVLQAYEKIAQR